uniref:Uncharacterized protein n=1 Tax=Cacopsylla melanoneura TaxID=428564 RepID=A0A8D8SNH3_9HEMI
MGICRSFACVPKFLFSLQMADTRLLSCSSSFLVKLSFPGLLLYRNILLGALPPMLSTVCPISILPFISSGDTLCVISLASLLLSSNFLLVSVSTRLKLVEFLSFLLPSNFL